MRRMAHLAAFYAHGRMLKRKWPALVGVTFQAGFLVHLPLTYHGWSGPMRQLGEEVPWGLWQSLQAINLSLTRCLKGIETAREYPCGSCSRARARFSPAGI